MVDPDGGRKGGTQDVSKDELSVVTTARVVAQAGGSGSNRGSNSFSTIFSRGHSGGSGGGSSEHTR